MRWQAGADGERYKVQVAAHESFAEPLLDTEQAVPEVAVPDMSGPVYVRIKRIAADGFPGEFEAAQMFEPTAK